MSREHLIQELNRGVITDSAETTQRIAQALAPLVPHDHVLALHGDLGGGKTTFVKGLAHAWKITAPVTSPTFNLYFVYYGSRQLLHLDAYRLESGNDLNSLMIEDFLQSPWCLAVEWPERITEAIPSTAWHLFFSVEPDRDSHRIRLETK